MGKNTFLSGPVYIGILRAHLHQVPESVNINAAMMLVTQFHWPQWSHLRMGFQLILERLHCGQ